MYCGHVKRYQPGKFGFIQSDESFASWGKDVYFTGDQLPDPNQDVVGQHVQFRAYPGNQGPVAKEIFLLEGNVNDCFVGVLTHIQTPTPGSRITCKASQQVYDVNSDVSNISSGSEVMFNVSMSSRGPFALNVKRTKLVTLVRHGESNAQTYSQEQRHCTENNELMHQLWDPYLSEVGVAQADALGQDWYGQPELVISSPLSRALQTAQLIFSTARYNASSVVAYPALCEIGGKPGTPAYFENRGRLLEDLENDPVLKGLDVEWSLIPSGKWWPETVASFKDAEATFQSFCDWLEQRPERDVVVVCHHNVIQRLLENKKRKVSNCTQIRCAFAGGRFLEVE